MEMHHDLFIEKGIKYWCWFKNRVHDYTVHDTEHIK